MKNAGACSVAIAIAILFASTAAFASDQIPKAAWKRAIGLPLENPGKEKAYIPYPHIDDGYWQGAPVGGFGAGTFSRSYRGDFSRWHIKAGVKFGKGEMGAANGIGADGSIIRTNEQVHEVWTGTTFAVAAFIHLRRHARRGLSYGLGNLQRGLRKYGYWFRTPEAWDETGAFRASMYMRAAAIWAMEMTEQPGKTTAATTK